MNRKQFKEWFEKQPDHPIDYLSAYIVMDWLEDSREVILKFLEERKNNRG